MRPTAGDYALEALAVPECLNLLHDLLEQVGTDHPELGSEDLSMFETAIIEIAGNVVEHGRPPGRVVFRFRLHVFDDRLVGVLVDSGEALDPTLRPGSMPEEMAESGRGLVLARVMLDEFDYRHTDAGNTWTMVRHRS
ncbi:MAG: ATP-binding protein [Friedmanniella sp.]|nr:ATP-binding protein [Friedmanniella sp.]